ncbi:MAG: hypothetical protein M1821_000886 [Bathelium mastoideum]|nr:MAG: hypothetical protein M1821_000886 [Bathelium mastoideum]KAI9694092.1 MAG: hypothetical protein M1822_003363 [Bathelium mastoideum]
MHINVHSIYALLLSLSSTAAVPVSNSKKGDVTAADINNPNFGPIPGESSYYSKYNGTEAPFPDRYPHAVPASSKGAPGPDDVLWQNLVSAEWTVYRFYQTGVETFNESDFTEAGFPPQTYSRLIEIRDNEAGHLRIFQDEISHESLKPGPCKYSYPFTDAKSYLELQTTIELASMAFLTGLAQTAQLNSSKGALVAAAEVEARHEVWSLMDLWKTDPFAGPFDTSFPYASQILQTTNAFVVPGSCPADNPVYPVPYQDLPQITVQGTAAPGAQIEFEYQNKSNIPAFKPNTEYYAVFFHGVFNISVPYDPSTNYTTIPAAFEDTGLIIGVLADTEGAPTLDSVVAGPMVLVQKPAILSVQT